MSEGRTTMDRWERRLQLMARSSAPSAPESTALGIVRTRSAVTDEPGLLLAPPGGDHTDLVHPDEMPVVQTLLELALNRPEFHAELSLMARNRDRWEYHRFEVVNEVMGPVLRLAEGASLVVVEVGPDDAAVESHGSATRVPESDGSLNRRAVLEHLAEVVSRAGESLVAVLLLDLDRFKLHNDLLGPDGANELLGLMAERVRETAMPALSGSIGGDEFIVVMEQVDDPALAQDMAEAVRRAIAEPIEVSGERLNVTATVGVSVGGADASPEHLLRNADTALFTGKDRGRDRVQVFSRQLEARVARQLSTANQLRHALAAGTLELHYQPVVSLETGLVVAAEALMRIDGERDAQPISPSSLIEAAEDHGLIARLGRYVLEETTTQIARWESMLSENRVFRVSVNISPVQLSNRDFSGAIAHALGATRVSASRLSLELTESVLLGSSPTVDLIVQELVDLGIAIGLDDFGAEGSSLAGLRRFPIAFLKIDRDLVASVDRDLRVETIIASTVSMARQLGVTTVAVGVERESQRDLLRRLGCDSAQGYLFSPPLTAAAFTEQL